MLQLTGVALLSECTGFMPQSCCGKKERNESEQATDTSRIFFAASRSDRLVRLGRGTRLEP
jgi:hypothetical protein